MATEWYYAIDDEQHGPISASELKSLARSQKIQEYDLVWRDGMKSWSPAHKVSGLFAEQSALIPASTEETSAVDVTPPETVPQKTTALSTDTSPAGKPAEKSASFLSRALDAAGKATDLVNDKAAIVSPGMIPQIKPMLAGKALIATSSPQRELDPLEKLTLDAFQTLVGQDTSLMSHPEITVHKLKAVQSHYAAVRPDETVLCIQDPTLLRTGMEGLVLTTRGLYWHSTQSLKARLEAAASTRLSTAILPVSKTSSGESLRYKELNPDDVFLELADERAGTTDAQTDSGVIVLGPERRMGLAKVGDPVLAEVVQFIRKAAHLARGTDAQIVLPRAEKMIDGGQFDEAFPPLKELLERDSCHVSRALPLLKRICEAAPRDPVKEYVEEIAGRVADRSNWWYVRDLRAGVAKGPFSLDQFQTMRKQGTLFSSDFVKHFSNDCWVPVHVTEELGSVASAFYCDSGLFVPKQYQACREALGQEEGLGEPAFFSPTQTAHQEADGAPIIHIALTDREFLFLWKPAAGETQVERVKLEACTWSLTLTEDQLGRLDAVTPDGKYELDLSDGTARQALVREAQRVFFDRATANFEEQRYFQAETFLLQIPTTGGQPESHQELVEKMGVVAQAMVVYEGGHPGYVEKVVGSLRLDGIGVEFTSIVPGSETHFRIPYGNVIDLPSPQRGQLPSEIVEELEGKRRTGQFLKMGLGIAASAVVPGGGMLVGGLFAAGGGGKGSGPPPTNRLCVVLVIDQTPHKLFFDVLGETTEDLNEQTREFWNKSAPTRSRFRKAASAGGSAVPSAAIAEQTKLLREIRDLLQTFTSAWQLSELHQLQQLQASGELSEEEFEERMSALQGERSEATACRKENVVVACPKCEAKLRAANAGVIQCPKCQTKTRVRAELFQLTTT